MYIRRTLDQHFREAADHFPVMLVTGALSLPKSPSALNSDLLKI
jgi:hypothetical protein